VHKQWLLYQKATDLVHLILLSDFMSKACSVDGQKRIDPCQDINKVNISNACAGISLYPLLGEEKSLVY
jgi:hypothetical protein